MLRINKVGRSESSATCDGRSCCDSCCDDTVNNG